MPTDGRELERIVAWIQSTLGAPGEVQHDVTLPDVDGGDPRQIDVLVTMNSGPLVTILIGEVRDRGRRADVRWVEEVAAKRDSVGAHGAFLVSRAGFTALALAKVRARRMQAFTFEHLTEDRWEDWIRCFSVHALELTAGLDINIFDVVGDPLKLHPDFLARLEAAIPDPPTAKSLGASENLVCRVLSQAMIAAHGELRAQVAGDDFEQFKFLQPVSATIHPPEPTIDESGKERMMARAQVDVLFTRALRPIPVMLSRYVNEVSGTGECEVFEGVLESNGEPFRVRLLTQSRGGVIPAGTSVSVQVEPQTARGRAVFRGAKLATVEHREPGAEVGSLSLYVSLEFIDE